MELPQVPDLRDGQQVLSFGSKVDPQGQEFTQALEKMLKQN